jgi:hypothetical protein
MRVEKQSCGQMYYQSVQRRWLKMETSLQDTRERTKSKPISRPPSSFKKSAGGNITNYHEFTANESVYLSSLAATD